MTTKAWKSEAVTIRVDYGKCTGRGQCVENCPSEVYDLVEGKTVAARVDDCIECCTCVAVCPEKAITHSACG